MTEALYEYKVVPAQVGMRSLVGIRSTEYPVSWGNYFDLSGRREGFSPRVLNMWAENLEHAAKLYLTDGMVRIRSYGEVCIIDDPRIPPEYMYNKLCFTGASGVTLEIVADLYGYLGDPDGELEQFTDPVEYYKKKGATYNPLTGIVSYTYHPKSSDL